MLVGEASQWTKVLHAKYGEGILENPDLSNAHSSPNSSLWLKDLCNIGLVGSSGGDWFEWLLTKKVGNGAGTRFWL